ncbi:unnamed protein product [Clonostachys byssicola]|uniref:HEAT repeat domain-containing protein n=1 Tax=Clonostachys byssicola TaxID=160290 RepID=A0A9N9Y4Z9_9HYPO|nr:unnamed protein product [Clonostachys byssicola]
MQLAALDALARQSSLPEDKLLSIQGFLESQEEYVRDAAFTVIGSQKKLSDCILSAIAAAFIDNRDGPGYGGALEILGNQSTLPLDIIRSLVNSVEFQHMDMKRNVFGVLSKQSNLPEDILRVFLAHLASPLTGTRKPAIVAIRNQPELPPSIYDGILSLLESSDQWCRWAAASALGGKGVLPKQARLRLRERLNDGKAIVRKAATLSLGRQSDLSNDDLWRIVKNLEDGEHDVRQAAALVLRNHPNLPNTILQYVKSLLEDEESYVRHAAVQALGGHPNLSQDLLLSIVERTSDEDRGVVASAMAALGGQATLSEETLRLLIKNLQNSGRCKDVRQGAISILNNSPANASIKLSELSTFPLLMKQDAFRVGATSSDNVDLRETFMSLLIQCSESHLAWYIHEGKSCIETRSGVQRLALENEERFRRAIEAHRKLFRMPEIRTGKVTLFMLYPK